MRWQWKDGVVVYDWQGKKGYLCKSDSLRIFLELAKESVFFNGQPSSWLYFISSTSPYFPFAYLAFA